jgi:hypothetical protein
MVEEDKEMNALVIKIIAKCQVKGVVGIDRVINGYAVKFRFSKAPVVSGTGNKRGDDSAGIAKVGDTLASMGDEITKSFTGG